MISSEKDMQRMLSFDGETSGWAYVNYKAYQSGIVLFDGKASKIGDNLWKISSNGTLNLEERQFDLKLSGKSNGSHVKLHGIASEGNLNYKIIFSGKFVETEDQNIYAISIVNSGLKNVETGQTIKLDHIGELIINSEKIKFYPRIKKRERHIGEIITFFFIDKKSFTRSKLRFIITFYSHFGK